MDEDSSIREIKGIGEKTEALFQKLGVNTAGDLLRFYPRAYDIYEDPVTVSELEEGTVAAVEGCVYGNIQVSPNRKLQTTTAMIKDVTGTLKVLWFRMPFLRNTLRSGSHIIVRGRVVSRRGSLVMEHPEIFQPAGKYQEKLHTMQPVYPLTAGLSNLTVSKAVREVMEHVHLQKETLPESIRQIFELCEYNYALKGIHFPTDKTMYMQARKRLVFEEFLEFILAVRQMKEEKEASVNWCRMKPAKEVDDFLGRLPYELTNAQKKVWMEIRKDLQSDDTMSRLIQGDVGSGKTIVAVLALLEAAYNGYQGAMMAPTEVLARQHYQSVCDMFEKYGVGFRAELLTGSMKAKERREAYARIESGEADVVINRKSVV